MRMNRGTLALMGALLVIIVVVLVVNNQQASAPGVTPTAPEAAGPLLPGVSGETIVRYEIRDNTTGDFVTLTKDTGGAWHIDATSALAGRDPDQTLINTTVGQIATINYSNTFQDDQLATFGMDHPAYTVLVTTSDNQLHTIYVGAKSPTSPRYYAVVEQIAIAEATEAATTEPGTFDVQPGEAIATEFVGGENANEEGVLPPATAEETQSSAPKRVFQATEEATPQAVGTEQIGGENANEEGTLPEGTPLVEVTAEATGEATAEVTAEATADVIQSPQVTLEGQQTIYLIPQTVIDTLKRWLTTPPYAPLPTGVPTLEATAPPLLEVVPTQATEPTAEASAQATAEATTAP